jgi:hypothetical protein
MHSGIGDRSMSEAIFFGNSAALHSFVKPEVMPGNVHGAALAHFVRDAAVSYSHETVPPRWAETPCRWWMTP